MQMPYAFASGVVYQMIQQLEYQVGLELARLVLLQIHRLLVESPPLKGAKDDYIPIPLGF